MSDSLRGELIANLIDWLEQEREAYHRAATENGIDVSIATTEPVAENVTETSLGSRNVPVNISPLAVRVLWFGLGEVLKGRDRFEDSPAQALYRQYGDRCKVWDSVPQPAFEDNPPRWVHDVILRGLRYEYLTELESLERGQLYLAQDLSRDLVNLFESDVINSVTALPVGGLRFAEDPTEIENVRFRSMTVKELGRLLADATEHSFSWRRRRSLLPPFPGAIDERWVLEVRTACNKLVQPQAGFQPQKLVLALQLLGFELHGRGFATTWTEPGPSLWRGGQGFRLPQRGETRDCSRGELIRALALAEKIPDDVIDKPTRRNEIVLHRFLLGAANENRANALIDYVIALEGFLLPPSPEGEYRFKFSLFGAWYLGGDTESRGRLLQELRHIYDARSAIVHGAAPRPDDEIKQAAATARALAASMIVKALEEGWPSHDELRKAALG